MKKNQSERNNITAESGAESVLVHRLRDAGLSDERFIDLQDGTKKSITDHTNPANQFSPEVIEGNCGVMAGDGLVIIDVDYPDTLPDWLSRLRTRNPTLMTSSPHDEEGRGHLYYRVDGEIGVNKAHLKFDWGSVLIERAYAVAPVSVLDHDGYCKENCSLTGESAYKMAHSRPIARTTVEEIPVLQATEAGAPDSTDDVVEMESTNNDVDLPIDRRVGVAKESAHGEKFTSLWEGRYRDAEFDNRSDAEASLVAYLAFYLQGEKKAVRQAMNLAVNEHPRTADGNPRKWNDPEAGTTYRETLLEVVENVENHYTPPSSHIPGTPRPPTSAITRTNAHSVLMDLGIASTAEIAEHENFDRGQQQARRAINHYIDEGLVDSIRDGRRVLYYLDGLEGLIPPEKREKYGL